jgi:hypothetical protein
MPHLPITSRFAALARGFLPLVLVASLGACMPSIGMEQTSAFKGEAYQTQNSEYDDFFEAVAALKREMSDVEGADKEARESRKALAEALRMDKVDTEKMAARVAKAARKLASDGVLLKLKLDGIDADGKPVKKQKVAASVDTGGAHVEGSAKEVVAQLEETVAAQGAFLARFGKFPAQAKKLLADQAELVPKALVDFTSMKDRLRVQAELAASRSILEGVVDKTEKAAGVAIALLHDLDKALADASGDASEKSAKKGGDDEDEAPAKGEKKPEKKGGKKSADDEDEAPAKGEKKPEKKGGKKR